MTFSNITDIVIPEGNVTMIKDQANNIIWQKSSSGEIPEWYGASAGTDWSSRFMEIVPLDNGTVSFGYIDYSTDGVNWTSVRSPINVNMTKYVPVFVKSSVTYYSITDYTFDFYVRGNLGLSFPIQNTFYGYFQNNTRVIGAKYFIINCYQSWSDHIFSRFFMGCTNLLTPPQLPATTLSMNCYDSMFKNCTKMEGKILLPSTTLVQQCYANMFEQCEKLQYIMFLALNVNTQYGTVIDVNIVNWIKNISSSGTFVKHINATYTDKGFNSDYDVVPSGWDVIYYDPASSKYYIDQQKTQECDENGVPV